MSCGAAEERLGATAMCAETSFDPTDVRRLRGALGRFATGVTVIAARGADGAPIGFTANSFNSVSLNPPLILWSLARTSEQLDAYRAADAYAVNVLAAGQAGLAGGSQDGARNGSRASRGAKAGAARRCWKAPSRCSNARTTRSTPRATTSSSSAG